jgi:branched-chain amino acid transport system permease protein
VGIPLGQLLAGTLSLGSVYALISVGFVILFRATGTLNFAQGTFMVVGASIFDWQLHSIGGGPVAALVTCFAVLFLMGAAIYLIAFRRLVGAPHFVLAIATIGLGVLVQTVMFLVAGADQRYLPAVFGGETLIRIVDFRLTTVDVFSLILAVILVTGLGLLIAKTPVGLRMRAVSDNSLLASFNGVNAHRASALAWALSSLCAGAAGVAYGLRATLDPTAFQNIGLAAFPAVLLGGLDSMRGALFGGAALALIQTLAAVTVGGTWAIVLSYMLLLLVLLLRPRGLFGSQAIERL